MTLKCQFLVLTNRRRVEFQMKQKISKSILDSIYSLKDGEHLTVTYGKDRYDNKPREFRIKCYKNFRGDDFHYAIWETKGLGGMNIDKIGRTTMKGYTFDMMSQKTTYVFPLYKMKIVK